MQRRLQYQECLYDTDGPITSLFHSTLYYPQEISLRFDGFIVGIEKSPRDLITRDGSVAVHPIADAGLADRRAAARQIDDGKLLFISHVLRQTGTPSGEANCALYNAYDIDAGAAASRQLIGYCGGKPAYRTREKHAFEDSWKALDILERDIERSLASGQYTHVLVITMGWNTEQVEALRNMNSIAGNFARSFESPVNPLVIGVTWPSMWVSKWLDPAIKFASFPSKKEDADELGLTWLGALLHDTLPAARKGSAIPVIAIGHSFGGRATIAAACAGPIIAPDATPITRKPIGTTLIYQGAFRTDNLLGTPGKDFHYPRGCANVEKLVMTSSKFDEAVTQYPLGIFAGSHKSFAEYCGSSPTDASPACARADRSGGFTAIRGGALSNIVLVNADDLINEHAYGTGGGAHSDIFRPEHGMLLKRILDGGQPQAPLPGGSSQP